jgi:glycosyltransferase involved in cell wall biosynthesis
MPPAVTVVIPTRDRRAYALRAVATALAQRDVHLEVVVVDDGSRDGTAGAVEALGEPRVRVLAGAASEGVARARNRGIEAAEGGWVAFLDDDDLWAPGKLRVQLDAAERAGADWAYAAAYVVDAAGRPLRAAVSPPPPGSVARDLLVRNVIPAGSSNVVVRTEVVRALGGFDEQLAQLADWDLWLRLARHGRPAAVRAVLVAYTEHAGNMIHSGTPALLAEVDRVAAKHGDAAAAAGVRIDRIGVSRWIAWAQRRAGRRRAAARTYLRAAVAERSPGDAARAVATLLGERAMRGPRPPADLPADPPGWLAAGGRPR